MVGVFGAQRAGPAATSGGFPDPYGGPTWALRGLGGTLHEAPPREAVSAWRGRSLTEGPALGGGARAQRFKRAGRRRCAAGLAAGPAALGAGVWGSAQPTMLKRCGRRLLLALAGALLACLLVLTADPPPPPVPAERGRRALRSLAGPGGVAPVPGLEAAPAPGALTREVHSLSEYFSLLTRARRDAGRPPGGASRPADGRLRPQAEPLAPHDVFIAVKTTKKFHRARLDLLLETWISRHKEMVSPRGLGGRGGGPGPCSQRRCLPAPGCVSVQPPGVRTRSGAGPSLQPSFPGMATLPRQLWTCRKGPVPASLQSPGWHARTRHLPPVFGAGAR